MKLTLIKSTISITATDVVIKVLQEVSRQTSNRKNWFFDYLPLLRNIRGRGVDGGQIGNAVYDSRRM